MSTTFNTFINNTYATLASAYTAGAGSLVLSPGQGAQFGSTFPIEVTVATVGTYRTVAEISTIYTVTGRSTDTLTGVTAAEGTTDQNFAAGSIVEMRWTAGQANAISAVINAIQVINTPTPMDFPDGISTNIGHGCFWLSDGSALGACFYDMLVMNRTYYGYWISAGYGGDHALLFGYQASAQTGNLWSGTAIQSFGGDDAPAYGEWHHSAMTYDGTNAYCYIYGVPTGKTNIPSGRWNTTESYENVLYVGGSDHSNMTGRIAWLRAIEGAYPYSAPRAFHPEIFPGNRPMGVDLSANIVGLWDYTKSGPLVPDLSPVGYNGKFHPGRPFNASQGVDKYQITTGQTYFPCPSHVSDPTCPFNPTGLPASWGEVIPTPPLTPAGAIVFDSFSRRSSTWFHSATPSMGSTETGSQGIEAWNVKSADTWGILLGYAVLLYSPVALPVTWVETGTASQDVRVNRRLGNFGTGETGICFRFQDFNNYWLLANRWDGPIVLMKVVAGVATTVNSTTSYPAYTTLRVHALGSTITTYLDGTLLWTTSDSTLNTATKAGIGYASTYPSTQTSLGRWDNFTVLLAS